MIELKNVSKSYGRHKAVKDVSLTISPGEIVGLFGENGAGKSTLMKCILGLLRFYGEISLDGEPISRKNIERLSFATSEHSFFPALSPEGHAEFYAGHFPRLQPQERFDVLVDFFRAAAKGPALKVLDGTEEPV